MIVLIHDVKKRGSIIGAIARTVGCARKTVCKHLARIPEAPVCGPRAPRPRAIAPCEAYLRERGPFFPDPTGTRPLRKMRALGWGAVFGDPVVATALLDRPSHHAVVIRIEGASCRLRAHADLSPEHVGANAPIPSQSPPGRRGRPPKPGNGTADHGTPVDDRPRRRGEFNFGGFGEGPVGVDTGHARI